MTTNFFGAEFDEWFGSVGKSMYSLFQIMTLESWSMGIVRPVMIVYPLAWVFFVPFILITSFAVLNLFIGIIVDAMQQQNSDNGQEQSNTLLEELVKTQQTVNALRQDINRIKKRLEN